MDIGNRRSDSGHLRFSDGLPYVGQGLVWNARKPHVNCGYPSNHARSAGHRGRLRTGSPAQYLKPQDTPSCSSKASYAWLEAMKLPHSLAELLHQYPELRQQLSKSADQVGEAVVMAEEPREKEGCCATNSGKYLMHVRHLFSLITP